jgi:hypothetical protein
MHTGGILLTFASVCIGVSVIIALLFRFGPTMPISREQDKID